MNYTKLSKTIAHALRHAPWLYELELDDQGWTSVENLLEALRHHSKAWGHLTAAHLQEMIRRSDKQRFEIQGNKIRALYGHSIVGKLHKTPHTPPVRLYHGTSPQNARIILKEGLKPMGRQYVHLSLDRPTAFEVGRRKSSHPTILRILAKEACEAGVAFYQGNEKVWLADFIPPRFIELA